MISEFYYIKRQFFERQSIFKIGKIILKHSTLSLAFTFKGCRRMCNMCAKCAHGECLHVCMWLCTPRYTCTCMYTDMEIRGWHWITANLIFSDRVSQWTWNSLSKASQPENTRSLCLMGLRTRVQMRIDTPALLWKCWGSKPGFLCLWGKHCKSIKHKQTGCR